MIQRKPITQRTIVPATLRALSMGPQAAGNHQMPGGGLPLRLRKASEGIGGVDTKAYTCVVCDPPWSFRDHLPGPKRGASKHYDCDLSSQQLIELHVKLLGGKGPRNGITSGQFNIAPTSWLFLWRVASMQREAIDVAEACGYSVKSEIVWIKDKIGMGHYTRAMHETCLICTRGTGTSQLRLSASIPSVFHAPRGRHSEKPAEFYSIVETLCKGPRLELFARERRVGWTCWGNELDPVLISNAAE